MSQPFGPEAMRAARSIANYCASRFPCDTPPHDMLDVPWFAEKVQLAVNEATADLLAALEQIAELDGDCEQQKFKLTRFQASQVARAAIHKARAKS